MANLLSTTITGTATTSGSVVIGGTFANNAYNSVSSTRLMFGGGNEPNNYSIGTNLENYGGNYTKLDLRWHTGIRIGAQPGYGGVRFFSNETLSTRIMSIGETDANVRIDNNLWIGGAGGWITDLLNAKQNASTAITTSNIGSQSVSYATTSGTANSANYFGGFTAYGLVEEARGVHSASDFPNGTLVTTDIASNEWAGDSFVMEVSGKSYGSGTPFKLAMEGYLYANTIINVSAMSYGSYFPAPVKVMNLDGTLAFWWPRGSYWNSFQVHVRAAGGESWNRVTGISDSVDPPSATKKISITPVQVIHTNNIGSQSVNYAASAGNADTVDGFHASVAGSANTIPTRNASGYLIPENWIQLNGIYGLYSPTNNAHFRPNPNSYGSWLVTGGRNGWGGIEFDYGNTGNISLMISGDSNTLGFHNNSYGWQIRWHNGTLYVGKNPYGGGTDATVLDSSNYSSWAQPASTAINTSNIGSQSVNYANSAGSANAVTWSNVSGKPSLDYQQEYTFTAPPSPDGSGYVWVRMSMGGFNSGGNFVKFSISRAIGWNGANPYGGPSMDVVAYSREWHGGQEGTVITYAEHGSVPGSGFITNAGPRDLAGGGYWFYMRVWAGIDYAMRVYRGSGQIGTEWEETTDPTRVYAIRTGVNNVGDVHVGLNTNGDAYASRFYDYNDTSYYGDFHSRSVLNSLQLGSAGSDTSNLKLDVQGNMAIRGSNGLYFGVSSNNYNSWTTKFYASGSTQYFNAQSFVFDNQGYGGTTFVTINGSGIYNNFWYRNYGNQGMYNESYGTHFYSNNGQSWVVTGSGGNIQLEFRSNHQSTIRGFVYADTGNNIGFLNNVGGWAFRTTYDNNALIYGSDLTIGVNGANATSITMGDGDEGARAIHCNSNRIGFLNQAGSWGSWCSDDGSWSTAANLSVSGVISLPQNPVGTTYGNGVSANPPFMFYQGAGNDDGIRFYSESAASNQARMVFEIIDDIEEAYSDQWVFRNKKTYGDYVARNEFQVSGSGDAQARSSMRAPIFYDSNDTNYLVDPNSYSQLSGVLANNWFRPQGNTGVYFQTYGRGIWAADSAGSSYGSVSIYGSGLNDWPGWAINNLAVFMARDIRRGIFIPSADSWLIRYEESVNEAFVDFQLSWGSDIRYKSNVNTISSALDKVTALRGVTYNYKGSEKTSIGFIAQEVEQVVPEVVSTDIEGFKGVGYANMVALLTEAIKEQQTIINDLKARIELLESK